MAVDEMWGPGDAGARPCCSWIEQLGLDVGGVAIDQGRLRGGWRISEVEALLGLGRRDIQRACYGGAGGVAILEPADTAWGRRTYDVRDLAQLFMVRQYRRRGLSLPEVKEALDEAGAAGRSVEDMLRIQVARLADQAEEAFGQLLQAEALLAAVAPADAGPVEDVVARHVGARVALAPDEYGALHDDGPRDGDGPSCIGSLLASEALVDSPGMALAVDLWLGPGSAEALREAAEGARANNKTMGEDDEQDH